MSDAASKLAPAARLRVAVYAVDVARRIALGKVIAEAGHIVVDAQDGWSWTAPMRRAPNLR